MAAVDYFLKIDGIDGESQDTKHKGEIEIDSWSWARPNGHRRCRRRRRRRQGRDAGLPLHDEGQQGHRPSSCSPAPRGEHIKKAVLTCRKAGKEQQEYLKITFSDLLVSSYQTGGRPRRDVSPGRPDQPEFREDRVRVQGAEVRRHARRHGQGRLGRQGEQEGLTGPRPTRPSESARPTRGLACRRRSPMAAELLPSKSAIGLRSADDDPRRLAARTRPTASPGRSNGPGRRSSRDLEWLLNSRQVLARLPAEPGPLGRSLLTYGLPDLASPSLSNPADQDAAPPRHRRGDRAGSSRGSPRRGHARAGPRAEPPVRFRIDAMLKVEPEPEPVTFDSLLKLDTKSFVVQGESHMIDELLAYYNAELAFLREMGAEFAAKLPEGRRPAAARGRQVRGPARRAAPRRVRLPAARIRRKIDDEFPEITDALLGVLYPHYQRPFPSMAIVQFLPGRERPKVTAGRHDRPRGRGSGPGPSAGIPAGSARPTRSRSGRSRSTAARLDPTGSSSPASRAEAGGPAATHASARTGGADRSRELPIDRLRFYLDGDGPLAYALYELLLNHVCRVWVRGTSPTAGPRRSSSPAERVRPVGFGRDEGMFAYPSRSFLGYRLLQEYFAFPEKFLFFDLDRPGRLGRPEFGDAVEVLLLPRPRAAAPTSRSRRQLPARLHAGRQPVPDVAEPIRSDQTAVEYRVVPDVHRPLATEVYSIDRVTSAGGVPRRARSTYEPFYSFRHARRDRPPRRLLVRDPAPVARKDDPGTDVYLSFVDPDFDPRLPAVRDADRPRHLHEPRPTDPLCRSAATRADFELESPARSSRVRCLRKPTPALRPPLGAGPSGG